MINYRNAVQMKDLHVKTRKIVWFIEISEKMQSAKNRKKDIIL